MILLNQENFCREFSKVIWAVALAALRIAQEQDESLPHCSASAFQDVVYSSPLLSQFSCLHRDSLNCLLFSTFL